MSSCKDLLVPDTSAEVDMKQELIDGEGVTTSDERRRFNCELCDQKFNWRRSLKIHVETLHQGKTHQCPQCEKTFTHLCNLQRHLKTVHQERAEKNISVEYVLKVLLKNGD